MEHHYEDRNSDHFPEDRDSPGMESQRSSFKKIYYKFPWQFNFALFVFIVLLTLASVSFSLYIVTVKYF